jgi:hypothetical protein
VVRPDTSAFVHVNPEFCGDENTQDIVLLTPMYASFSPHEDGPVITHEVPETVVRVLVDVRANVPPNVAIWNVYACVVITRGVKEYV